MLFKTVAVTALILSAVFAAPHTSDHQPPFNPEGHQLPSGPRSSTGISQTVTNAQRLKAGLPLKAPHRRHYDYPSPTNVPYPAPSNYPGSFTRGVIQMLDATTGKVVGYVGKSFVIDGEYGIVSPSAPQDERLLVGVNRAARGPQNIPTFNGADDRFPYLGCILGFGSPSGDLGPGSFSYTYLGGTKRAPVGCEPQALGNSFTSTTGIPREAESAVFIYNLDGTLTVRWINESHSVRPCPIFTGVIAANVLFTTGDKDEFSRVFGPATWVEWKFVPV